MPQGPQPNRVDLKRILISLGLAVVVAVVLIVATRGRDVPRLADGRVERGEMVAVEVPALGPQERLGQQAFGKYCASCHGLSAGGRDGLGPPLVHVLYGPERRSDAALALVVEYGMASTEWTFGDMPPQGEVTDAEIASIIAFVRAVQRANGIE